MPGVSWVHQSWLQLRLAGAGRPELQLRCVLCDVCCVLCAVPCAVLCVDVSHRTALSWVC